MERVSQNIRKIIRSLSSAKGRKEHGLFVTERTKNVLDLIDGPFELKWIVANGDWYAEHKLPGVSPEKKLLASAGEMERLTSMSTAPDVLAVFFVPSYETDYIPEADELCIALDGVQDPGNLGTIIRLADWFGVKKILAGKETVDVFNPKCVISTMGSIGRVEVIYCDLTEKLGIASEKGIKIWGTFLEGENIYDIPPASKTSGIILFGNEGRGISQPVARLVTDRISIPSYPPESENRAESLNVAIAAAITIAEFRRQLLTT